MFVPATDTDVPRIVELMNRAYRGARGATSWAAEQAYIAGDRTTAVFLREDLAFVVLEKEPSPDAVRS